MPRELDPAWEYFEPDPEVQELFEYVGSVEAFGRISDYRLQKEQNLGFRFGSGSPDHGGWGHLAPKKIKYREKPEIQAVFCLTCGMRFLPNRVGRKYCGTKCYKPKGAERLLPESTQCPECPIKFRPLWSGHRFCCLACASKAGVRTKAPSRVFTVEEEFKIAWERGDSTKEIKKRFNIATPTVKKWRDKLGLKPRPSGNQSGKARR